MSIIQFLFSDGKQIFEFDNIIKLNILEREGYVPQAIITLPENMYDTLCSMKACLIKKGDDEEFFVGKIEYFSVEENEIYVELRGFSSEIDDDFKYITDFTPELDRIRRFKKENPELVKSANIRPGETISSIQLSSPEEPLTSGTASTMGNTSPQATLGATVAPANNTAAANGTNSTAANKTNPTVESVTTTAPANNTYDVNKADSTTSNVIENELVEKFLTENPDLSEKIIQTQTNRLGQEIKSSIFEPDKTPIPLDDYVLYGSLKIEKDNKNIVSKVNLNVSASWIKRVEGDLDLTTKIANRFPEGQINTLTPTLLIDSWPKFGDRLSNYLHSSKTKYSIGHSILKQDNSKIFNTNKITISDDIEPFVMKKTFFDHKLSIFWEFDQFSTETVNSVISNSFAENGITKNININLQNVQEYINDPEEHSFFTSSLGQKILNKIYKSIQNFIILSMRNIKISCSLPFAENLSTLNCGDWISVKGFIGKITKLEYKLTASDKSINIVAETFSQHFDYKKEIKIPAIKRPERKEFLAGEIIHDINIKNNATEQYRKLRNFIVEQRALNKINKSNYKQLIKTFLHENQTKINIITKPLKTSHCEKSYIKTESICL